MCLEFLVNCNGYDFGETSSGKPVGDVELPPWAEHSPSQFIRIHRYVFNWGKIYILKKILYISGLHLNHNMLLQDCTSGST